MTLSEVKPVTTADYVFSECRADLLDLIRWQGLVRPDDEEDFLHYSYVREKGYCYLSKWTGSCNLASWMMQVFKWHYRTFLREQTGINHYSESKKCPGIKFNSDPFIEQYSAPKSYVPFQCHGADSTSMNFDWPILVNELNSMMPNDQYKYVLSGMIDGKYMNKIAEEMGVCRQTVNHIYAKILDICNERTGKCAETAM
jgi:hypothetical protein